MNISRDEWLAALGEAVAPPDPLALTASEIRELIGFGETATRQRINALLKAKRVVRTFKIIETAAGARQRVPAYRLVTAKGKK